MKLACLVCITIAVVALPAQSQTESAMRYSGRGTITAIDHASKTQLQLKISMVRRHPLFGCRTLPPVFVVVSDKTNVEKRNGHQLPRVPASVKDLAIGSFVQFAVGSLEPKSGTYPAFYISVESQKQSHVILLDDDCQPSEKPNQPDTKSPIPQQIAL